MKIYFVVEEYEGTKHVIHAYRNYDQIDYSKDAAIELRNRWEKLHANTGAVYYVKEVEL